MKSVGVVQGHFMAWLHAEGHNAYGEHLVPGGAHSGSGADGFADVVMLDAEDGPCPLAVFEIKATSEQHQLSEGVRQVKRYGAILKCSALWLVTPFPIATEACYMIMTSGVGAIFMPPSGDPVITHPTGRDFGALTLSEPTLGCPRARYVDGGLGYPLHVHAPAAPPRRYSWQKP